MTKIRILCNCICMLVLLSCNNKETKKEIKHYFKDGSGYVISEYNIENGDTILDGKYSVYDNNSKLKKEGVNIDNKAYGITKFYYDNGNLKSIKFIDNDKEIGEKSWYHNNGIIQKYAFYDDFGKVNFIANYDKEGVLETCEGLVLIEIYQFKLREQNKQKVYKIGDKIKYQFMFPNIPNTERKFSFDLLGYDNSKIRRKIKRIEPVTTEVEEQTVKKGRNTINAYIQYKFKDKRKEVLSDTISFDFFVK